MSVKKSEIIKQSISDWLDLLSFIILIMLNSSTLFRMLWALFKVPNIKFDSNCISRNNILLRLSYLISVSSVLSSILHNKFSGRCTWNPDSVKHFNTSSTHYGRSLGHNGGPGAALGVATTHSELSAILGASRVRNFQSGCVSVSTHQLKLCFEVLHRCATYWSIYGVTTTN